MKYTEDLLKARADEKFADFQSRLIPNVDRSHIIGVRTPVIRALAKELLKDVTFTKEIMPCFLCELPHAYFDEMLLHGEIISREKDYGRAMDLTQAFLPFIDNWAVCDLLDPKVFGKNKDKLFETVKDWLASSEVYTVRFGIDMMIKHFLDDRFEVAHLDLVNNACGDDYYIKMAKAWYFSFALIKQYQVALQYIKQATMDDWVRNKSLQKARESYRLTEVQKEELKTLKNTFRV